VATAAADLFSNPVVTSFRKIDGAKSLTFPTKRRLRKLEERGRIADLANITTERLKELQEQQKAEREKANKRAEKQLSSSKTDMELSLDGKHQQDDDESSNESNADDEKDDPAIKLLVAFLLLNLRRRKRNGLEKSLNQTEVSLTT